MSSIDLDRESYYLHIMSMWSLVHGIALLIANKVIEYDGDYLELVERMLNEKIK